MIREASLVGLALTLAACGGSVEQSGGTGGSGAGGSGTGGSGALGGGGSGGGVAGGGSGGMAGAGGAAGSGGACNRTHDTLSVKISPATSESGPECSMGAPTKWEVNGQVVKSSGDTFVLDSCPPNADCMAMHNVIQIGGVPLGLPMGTFVKVKYALNPAWGGCTKELSIRNLPEWGGEKNPVIGDSGLWFAGVDGQKQHPDAPFSVSTIALGCNPGAPSCGGVADDFAFSFSVGPGDPGTVVYMGQTTTVMGPQAMAVRNLRSFESGACDDYWNWAWWARRTPWEK